MRIQLSFTSIQASVIDSLLQQAVKDQQTKLAAETDPVQRKRLQNRLAHDQDLQQYVSSMSLVQRF